MEIYIKKRIAITLSTDLVDIKKLDIYKYIIYN